MKKTGFYSLISNRNFMLLWGEQILSQFAYNLVNFALIVWVFKLSNSNLSVSLLILSIILPTAFFGMFTGVVSDFFDRRRIMLIIHAIWAVFVLLFIFVKDSLPLVLLFSFFLNTIDRFFTPAEQSSIPKLVHKDNLLLANSLFSFSLNAGFLLGFSIAGPLMLVFGNEAPFFLASFLVFTGLFFVWFLPALLPSSENKIIRYTHLFKQTISEIKKGYEFVKNTKIIFATIVIFSIFQIGMNSAVALFPSFVVNILGFPDVKQASPLIMLPVGAGTILALVLLRIWQNKLKRFLIWRGIMFAGIAFITLGLLPLFAKLFSNGLSFAEFSIQFPLFYIIIFIASGMLGMAGTLVMVPLLTIISQYTPCDYLGRAWGVTNLIQNTVASIPLILFGAVADRISVLPIIFVFAFFLIVMYTFRRSTRLRVLFRENKDFSGLGLFLEESTKKES